MERRTGESVRIEETLLTGLNLDITLNPFHRRYNMTLNTVIKVKTAHLRSVEGRAAQKMRARERLKRLKMERALIEKASRPAPPEPRPRSGEAYVAINIAATKN